MITFVRTTGGSDLNLGSIVEAVSGADGLVTLFLSDGEIRHATKSEWARARHANGQRLLAAAPNTFVLRQTIDDEPEVFREPVIAWVVNRHSYPEPMTIEGIACDDVGSATVMTPDGSVQNAYHQFPDYETWLRSTLEAHLDLDRELGVGGRRAYYHKDGRVRFGDELDPCI